MRSICSHRSITVWSLCRTSASNPSVNPNPITEIYHALAKRLGLGEYYSEGMTEFDWCRRMYEASDLAETMSWKKFLRKGYYVVPAEKKALRQKPAMNWFYEDRKKDLPDPAPLPGEYTEEWRRGLQTPSGKFEFTPSTLKRFDANDPERPPVNRYLRSWSGPFSEAAGKYPLQLLTPHPRYTFHTQGDGKDSILNEIDEHRMVIDGRPYRTVRLNSRDAAQRGINERDLVKLYNDRGAIVCAARVTDRIRPGTVHVYGIQCDICSHQRRNRPGGLLPICCRPKRMQIKKAHSMAGNAGLIQAIKWDPGDWRSHEKVESHRRYREMYQLRELFPGL